MTEQKKPRRRWTVAERAQAEIAKAVKHEALAAEYRAEAAQIIAQEQERILAAQAAIKDMG